MIFQESFLSLQGFPWFAKFSNFLRFYRFSLGAVNPEKLVPDPTLFLVNNPGFELAVHNLQFAKHFGSLQMSFCIFSLKIANHENQILHEFLELFIELAI